MVRIQRFHCCSLGSILGRGTEIPQARQHGQKKKKNQKAERMKKIDRIQRWRLPEGWVEGIEYIFTWTFK